MPKAGSYEYPFYDIETVLAKLRTVYDRVRTDEIDRIVFADELKMAPRGGGFAYIVSALNNYGFADTGRGKIVVTELGKLALHGNAEEVEQAYRTAASNIKLFQEIYQTYGVRATEEQIRAFLRQKAQIDVTKATKTAETIYKIYIKLASYFRLVEKPEQVDASQPTGLDRSEVPVPRDVLVEPLVIKHGQVYIQLPPDDLESLELAEQAIVFMKGIVRKKMEETE